MRSIRLGPPARTFRSWPLLEQFVPQGFGEIGVIQVNLESALFAVTRAHYHHRFAAEFEHLRAKETDAGDLFAEYARHQLSSAFGPCTASGHIAASRILHIEAEALVPDHAPIVVTSLSAIEIHQSLLANLISTGIVYQAAVFIAKRGIQALADDCF